MTRLTKIKRLKWFLKHAPKNNRGKMDEVLQGYESGKTNNYNTAENAMIALSHPSIFGPRKIA